MIIKLTRAVHTFLRIIICMLIESACTIIFTLPIAIIGAQRGYKDEDIDSIDADDIIDCIVEEFFD